MNYLGAMTLSGTCFFFIAKLGRKISKNDFPAKQFYLCLKVAILFYLVPLFWLRSFYEEAYRKCRNWLQIPPKIETNQVFGEYRYVYENGKLYLNQALTTEVIIIGIWMIAAMGVLIWQISKYLKAKRMLLNVSMKEADAQDSAYVEQCRGAWGMRRQVILKAGVSDGIKNFTIGILRPVVFYDAEETESDKKLLLLHELVHIRRMDMVWKILSVAVLCLHWMNPFAWWCVRELERACEESCDEEVQRGLTMEETMRYAQLIVEHSQKNGAMQYSLSLSKEGKKVKERVEMIMNRMEKKKKYNKWVGIVSLCGMILLNSLTVFAYPRVDEARLDLASGEQEDLKELMLNLEGEEWFIPEGSEDVFVIDIEEVRYDMQFVDEEGNIYEVTESDINGEVTICATCNHEYVSGRIQNHKLNSGGGCTIYLYEAQRCTKCGNVLKGELINQTTYVTCPH